MGPYGPAVIGAGSAIPGMYPPLMPTQGYGDPYAGYGLPNQVMPGLPQFSLPQSGFPGFGLPQSGFPGFGFPGFGLGGQN